MKKKRKITIKQVKRYLHKLILKEAIRMDAEKPDSPYAFMRKTEKQKKFEDLNCILDHFQMIPEQLYKYRTCNENNFKALEKKSVWLSSAKNFVDPYDCRLPFSIKDLPDKKINKLMKWFVFTDYIVHYHRENLEKYDALTPKEVRKIMFSRCYNDELKFNGVESEKFIKKHYPKEDWDFAAQNFILFDQCISRRGRGAKLREWFRNDAEIGCQETVELNRNKHYVCSLTEINDNAKMWEEYAGNYTGFCIGFDFSQGVRADLLDSPGHVAVLQSILPVFYTNKRPKFDSYKFQLRQYENEFYEDKNEYWEPELSANLTLHTLFKNPTYSNEQEWRIIVGGEEEDFLPFPFFASLYLGKDISEENKKRLLEIAKKINVTVYQQQLGVDGFTYYVIQEKEPPKILWNGEVTVFGKDLL